MVTEMKAAGARPIVLTPFRSGDSWSNHLGEQFSADIEALAGELGFDTVNGQHLLREFPVRQVLLADGFHIAELAHAVIAKELFRVILQAQQLSSPVERDGGFPGRRLSDASRCVCR
jgi:hypothetical protein